MQYPEIPECERQRLQALYAMNVLDTLSEERFDRITRLASHLFNVPIALVSLVDENRQWFKSSCGLGTSETPRNISFCGHAILSDEVMVVNDALQDPRFADNPLVTRDPKIRFYAGYPLHSSNGYRIGVLCLNDRKPREFSANDIGLLRDLGRMVEDELHHLQLAITCELTGLSNRRGFIRLAEYSLTHCLRLGLPACLYMLDIDNFKHINDRFGHTEGDKVLRQLADLLLATMRHTDVIARIGGDEFALFTAQVSDSGINLLRDRLIDSCARLNAMNNKPYSVEFSVGHACLPSNRPGQIEQMLAIADKHMYQQKRINKRYGGIQF